MGVTNEKWVWFTATRGHWNPLSKILHPPLTPIGTLKEFTYTYFFIFGYTYMYI